MRIIGRNSVFVHTSFRTDAQWIDPKQIRRIRHDAESFLRAEGIVFGIHFAEPSETQGIQIVLECIPLLDVLDRFHSRLEELVKDLPTGKPVVRKVRAMEQAQDTG